MVSGQIDFDAQIHIKSFWFYPGENYFWTELSDDYVTVDNIEFNQNTLTYSASTHTIGPMKFK